MDQIYLDNNATTRIDPQVVQAMNDCYAQRLVNPASQHQLGRAARRILETAREKTGQILGCHLADTRSDRVIYTSGGTEANNLALFGLPGEPPAKILISAIEHPSVTAAADHLQRSGYTVGQIPVNCDGVICSDAVRELLTDDVRLVSLMLGNNETGTIQPVQEIAEICHERGVLVHTDAVQAVGKIPISFTRLRVDALSFTGHKFHGPRGIGGLLLKANTRLNPLLFGGFQQGGLRPGTESVALAVGLQRALEIWQLESAERLAQMIGLRNRLENAIRQELPNAVVNGAAAERLPHTTSISFPGLDRQAIAMALDLAGVACATGSACASGSSEKSPVLIAMGIPDELVNGAIRLSLGADSTQTEIDEAIRRICKFIKNLYR